MLSACDGQAALALARSHAGAIDLLLTDLVMPTMSGRDLANALLAERPGIKALFMSGYTHDPMFRQSVLEQDAQYLEKPFKIETLARKIRDVLAG